MSRDLRTPLQDPAQLDEASTFLTRWSRRKRGLEAEEPAAKTPAEESLEWEEGEERALQPAEAAAAVEANPAEADPIDPRTGKRLSELTDEDMPDIDSLTEQSDLSVFMAKQVSSALRMRALSKVFMSPKYNVYCLCAEYAEDYTNFSSLGSIVPHDLQQAIAREAAKLCQRLLTRGVEVTQEEVEARVAAQFRGEELSDGEIETEFLLRAGVDPESSGGSEEPSAASVTDQAPVPDVRSEAT